MKKIQISVIIPAWNEEKTLPNCLKSLEIQKTKFNYEVIVVDYKSSDRTRTIARKYGVRVVTVNEAGRAAARNKGAKNALGEILAYTEADCIVNNRWIETIGSYLNKNRNVIGLTGIYSFYNSTPFYNLLSKMLYVNEYLYFLLMGNHSTRGSNLIVRKSILMEAGGFNHGAAPGDDFDLGVRIRKRGPIHFLPQLKIQNSDRRIRGRLFKFLGEFVTSYFKVYILKRRGLDLNFETIR